MTALAQPYRESLDLVAVALREAVAAADTDKEGTAFARNCVATGMEHLRGLARRYSASREARDVASGLSSAPRPIVSDPGFLAAANSLTAEVDAAKDLIGKGADRIAAILREWVRDKSPTSALQLAIIADTIGRAQKKKADR